MKTCVKCGEDKALTEFSPRSNRPDGQVRSACKPCNSAAARAHYAANKHQHRLRAYGLTQEAYDTMQREQGGVCAICELPSPKDLWVDHCHDSGRVRGLLCPACNIGIGHLGDDPDRLQRAVAYLR